MIFNFSKNLSVLMSIAIATLLGVLSCGTSIFSIWIGMEVITFSTVFYFTNKGKSFFKNHLMLKYLIIQSFTAFSILIFLMMAFPEDCSLESSLLTESNIFMKLTMISLWFKMGLFPFHSWILEVLYGSSVDIFFMINNWNKILPFFLITSMSLIQSSTLVFIKMTVFLNLLFVSQNIFKSYNFFYIMFFSGVMHSMNIIMLLVESMKSFFFFYIMSYYIMLYFFFFEIKSESQSIDFSMEKTDQKNLIVLGFFFFTMSGFPPSAFFFIKVYFFWGLSFSSSSAFFFLYILMISSIYMFFFMNIIVKSFSMILMSQKYQNNVYYKTYKNKKVFFGITILLFLIGSLIS